GPSAYGQATFPLRVTVAGDPTAPAPQRYDLVREDLLVVHTTFAVAWHVLDFVSVGAAFHWVYSNLTFQNSVYLPGAQCGLENADCDYNGTIEVSQVFAPMASLGGLVRLTENLQLGLNWRSGHDIDADGPLRLEVGPKAPIQPVIGPGGAKVTLST